jgi:hypothetical protein
MKNINSFLFEYKQQVLWDELRPDIEVNSIKSFIDKFKVSKEIISNHNKFKTVNDVLNYYNRDEIDKIARDIVEQEHERTYNIYLMYEFDIEIIKEYIDTNKINLDEELTENSYIGDELADLFDFDFFVEWYIESKYFDWEDIIDTEYYDDLIYIIENNVVDNKLPIYRVMTIDKDTEHINKLDYNGIGLFWTYNENDAEAYCGEFCSKKHSILLKGLVDIRNIDWESTIYKSLYDLSFEREIEIEINVTVELTGYILENAISKYISLRNSKIEQFKKISAYKNLTSNDFRKMFRQEANNKYNIDLENHINIKV